MKASESQPLAAPAQVVYPEGFTLAEKEFRALPFYVLFAKVASVAQVSTSSALLKDLRESRLDLGDDDYAHGVPATSDWNARRMATWVAAVKPVCRADSLKALYPHFPDDISEFTAIALGRAVSPIEQQDIARTLAAADPSSDRFLLACLAILSSVEFIAR